MAVIFSNWVFADGGVDGKGASYALFSVSEGNRVHFSKGNLQFTTVGSHTVYGGDTITGTWRFAEYQYDYIGESNANISETYTGWIDLFGWGTSGWNSGAVHYQPWSAAGGETRYNPGGSSTTNLTDEYKRADWGVYNAISNGGNQPGVWRTLTKNEWQYLLNERTTSNIGETTNGRYAKATVAEVSGLIIFPDTYSHPSELPVPTNVNSNDAEFTSNTYDAIEWSYMEDAGAVFLPLARLREGTSVLIIGYAPGGFYWSSTNANLGRAYNLSFSRDAVGFGQGSRSHGMCVRLVADESSYISCENLNASMSQTICKDTFFDFFGTTLTESGHYSHIEKTVAGCDSIVDLTLTVNPNIVINGDTLLRFGDSTTLTAEGGVSYLWNNGATSPSINVGNSGIYSVTVTDANGCSGSTSITVMAVVHDTVVIHDTVINTIHDTIANTTYDTVINTIHDTITSTLYDTVTLHDTIVVSNIQTDTIYQPQYIYDTVTNIVYDTVTNTIHDTITNIVYDTVTVRDTVTVTNIQTDTIYLPQYIYDTVTNNVHDTTYVTNVLNDTIYLPQYIYDTVINNIHDTTYVTNVQNDTVYLPQYIYDTVTNNIHDTTYVTNVQNDTVYLPQYIYDTVTNNIHDTTYVTNVQNDTVYLPQYIYDTVTNNIHDTTYITNVQNDTVYLPQYIYDTLTNNIHDTTYVTNVQNDTVYLPQYIYDTLTNNIHDTTYVTNVQNDTVYLPQYIYDTVTNNVHDTTYVTNVLNDTVYLPQYIYDTVVNTVYDTVTNTIYDTLTQTTYDTTYIVETRTDTIYLPQYIYDTVTNNVHDTTYVTNVQNDTVYLPQYIYDTVINTVYDTVTNTIYDTIYVHDTVYVIETGIHELKTVTAKIYTQSGRIIVEDAGDNTVYLFDSVGRLLAAKRGEEERIEFAVSSMGVYLVKVGEASVKKVVVR